MTKESDFARVGLLYFLRASWRLRNEKPLSFPHDMNALPLNRRSRRFFLVGRLAAGQFGVAGAAHGHIADRAVFGGSGGLPSEFGGGGRGVGVGCLALETHGWSLLLRSAVSAVAGRPCF